MDAYQRKVLSELKSPKRITRKICAAHGDIEEAIVERGGSRGGQRVQHA